MSNNYIRIIRNLQNNLKEKKAINILFCDIQENFMPKVYKKESILQVASDIAEASKILKLSQIITEHKKDVFGPTVGEIMKHTSEKTKIYQKTCFPMLSKELINEQDKDSVFVLLGVEAHICVTQTSVNLLGEDRDLIILADCVSSSNKGDRNVALANLSKMGAYVTTSQSFLFLLLQDAKSPYFKQLLPILKRMTDRENELLNETLI
jgi:hypothetical protein